MARTLTDLKALGVGLAIDDFGTGYSSLSRLKRFPFDAVKVDQTFVSGLGTDQHDTALVAAILAMADALELETTAEGVETRAQLVRLARAQLPAGAGFLSGPAHARARHDPPGDRRAPLDGPLNPAMMGFGHRQLASPSRWRSFRREWTTDASINLSLPFEMKSCTLFSRSARMTGLKAS